MKTDREFLKLAAKAAGLNLLQVPNQAQTDADWWAYAKDAKPNTAKPWNPLTDDGDALRLVVELGLNVCVTGRCVLAHHAGDVFEEQAQDFGDDPYAATRRAIVRAAAAIGETL